jgi:hypothetical protein
MACALFIFAPKKRLRKTTIILYVNSLTAESEKKKFFKKNLISKQTYKIVVFKLRTIRRREHKSKDSHTQLLE